MKDIFTDMQAKIGCPYLSDLPYYKRAVWFEIKRLCLSDYPKKQLEDFSRYVFGVPYTVIQEALPLPLQNYIDYEAYGRDLSIEGTFIETSRGICEIPY